MSAPFSLDDITKQMRSSFKSFKDHRSCATTLLDDFSKEPTTKNLKN